MFCQADFVTRFIKTFFVNTDTIERKKRTNLKRNRTLSVINSFSLQWCNLHVTYHYSEKGWTFRIWSLELKFRKLHNRNAVVIDDSKWLHQKNTLSQEGSEPLDGIRFSPTSVDSWRARFRI